MSGEGESSDHVNELRCSGRQRVLFLFPHLSGPRRFASELETTLGGLAGLTTARASGTLGGADRGTTTAVIVSSSATAGGDQLTPRAGGGAGKRIRRGMTNNVFVDNKRGSLIGGPGGLGPGGFFLDEEVGKMTTGSGAGGGTFFSGSTRADTIKYLVSKREGLLINCCLTVATLAAGGVYRGVLLDNIDVILDLLICCCAAAAAFATSASSAPLGGRDRTDSQISSGDFSPSGPSDVFPPTSSSSMMTHAPSDGSFDTTASMTMSSQRTWKSGPENFSKTFATKGSLCQQLLAAAVMALLVPPTDEQESCEDPYPVFIPGVHNDLARDLGVQGLVGDGPTRVLGQQGTQEDRARKTVVALAAPLQEHMSGLAAFGIELEGRTGQNFSAIPEETNDSENEEAPRGPPEEGGQQQEPGGSTTDASPDQDLDDVVPKNSSLSKIATLHKPSTARQSIKDTSISSARVLDGESEVALALRRAMEICKEPVTLAFLAASLRGNSFPVSVVPALEERGIRVPPKSSSNIGTRTSFLTCGNRSDPRGGGPLRSAAADEENIVHQLWPPVDVPRKTEIDTENLPGKSPRHRKSFARASFVHDGFPRGAEMRKSGLDRRGTLFFDELEENDTTGEHIVSEKATPAEILPMSCGG